MIKVSSTITLVSRDFLHAYDTNGKKYSIYNGCVNINGAKIGVSLLPILEKIR